MWVEKIKTLGSRTVLTSGNLEPVSDNGFEGHSIFAYHLIKLLKDNNKYITGDELHNEIKKLLLKSGFNQTPQYQNLPRHKNEGGDFIFEAIY